MQYGSISGWLKLVKTSKMQHLGDEHPFTGYLGVHQGYQVMTRNLEVDLVPHYQAMMKWDLHV
jgi:hypothetical protein